MACEAPDAPTDGDAQAQHEQVEAAEHLAQVPAQEGLCVRMGARGRNAGASAEQGWRSQLAKPSPRVRGVHPASRMLTSLSSSSSVRFRNPILWNIWGIFLTPAQ